MNDANNSLIHDNKILLDDLDKFDEEYTQNEAKMVAQHREALEELRQQHADEKMEWEAEREELCETMRTRETTMNRAMRERDEAVADRQEMVELLEEKLADVLGIYY